MKAEQLYADVTNRVIADIEAGAGTWEMPWTRIGQQGAPRSVSTGKPYQGINWWVLSLTAQDRGYRSQWWATFNQWQALLPVGAQVVRKGEKAAHAVVAKRGRPSKAALAADPEAKGRPFFGAFAIFNAEQIVDPPARYVAPPVQLTEHERIEACESYFAAIGARVDVGGDRAFYASVGDYIGMPALGQFSTPEHYYSTLAHEHTHWTGHKSRLDRQLGNRFGTDAYAAEELIAELGAAFFSAQTGIEQATRRDHSSYLAGWLRILRADPKALLTAASSATKAIEYLNTAAAWQPETRELEPA